MRKNPFITEFNKKFRNTGLAVSPVKNGKDFVISNNEASKVLLVRTEYPLTTKKRNT